MTCCQLPARSTLLLLTQSRRCSERGGRYSSWETAASGKALSAADVAVGVMADGADVPWSADLLVDDLAGAWRLLHALPAAAAASRRGVELSTAASLLGALPTVPGVRGGVGPAR